MYKYQPRRPVKSFQDLDVYQQTHNLAIKVCKGLSLKGAATAAGPLGYEAEGRTVLYKTALSIPKLIATAHSVRFADPDRAIANLEQAMLNCNLMVVYLDQYRDLKTEKGQTLTGAATAAGPLGHRAEGGSVLNELDTDQLQKDYLTVRRKILNLQRSWQKFMKINKSQTP
ncbi:hypothetical protein KJ953_01725 [Patescibacteria group bacterium]|nr:hypothetical protein [Patescibacteria group bacterium]